MELLLPQIVHAHRHIVHSSLQMSNPGSPENLELASPSYLVELSVIAPTGQDQIQEDMKNFAEQLKPYPFMTSWGNFPHRRLQSVFPLVSTIPIHLICPKTE